jgi:hypothetical protein
MILVHLRGMSVRKAEPSANLSQHPAIFGPPSVCELSAIPNSRRERGVVGREHGTRGARRGHGAR